MTKTKLIPKLRFTEFNEEWDINNLEYLSTVKDGTHDSPKYYSEGFPLITSKNLLKNGTIDFKEIKLISKEDFDKINKRSNVDKGDILFGMIGTIGNPVIVDNDNFAIKNVALIKEKTCLKNKFLVYLLNTKNIAKQFYKLNAGGTQKFIALNLIRNLEINFPNLKEQEKIADFLSKIDEKIDLLNQNLIQMNQFKNGLMQQIFSQKLKFEGFNKEWEECYLKDLGDFYRGHSYNSSNVVDSGLLVLRSNNIQNNQLDFNEETLQFVDKPCKPELNLINGDIVICMSNGTKSLVGKSAKYKGNYTKPLTVGAFCSIFRSDSPLSEYIFQTYLFKKYMHILLAGTNINNLKNSDLEKMVVYIPEYDEQEKIANFLSNIDSKIDLIQVQLNQIEVFKKGLLQQMFV